MAYHNSWIKDHSDFADYTYISLGGCAIRMPPGYKDAVLEKLWDNFHIITHKADDPLVLNKGSPSCSIAMLQEIMVNLQVKDLRLAAYGMKNPFYLLPTNIGAGVPSQFQLRNHFDIGFTYYPYLPNKNSLQGIILVRRPPQLPKLGCETYPTLLELGEGFGTINLTLDHEAISRIKCYSTLTHALKATSQKDMKSTPTTTTTWNNRVDILGKKIEILRKDNPMVLCGIRFEATVYAQTAEQARDIAFDSGFLHPRNYLLAEDNSNSRIALEFKLVPVQQYFSYVDLMMRKLRRVQTEVSQKHENIKELEPHQLAACIDVTNALGWNGGKYMRPTSIDRSVVPNPWWDRCKFSFLFLLLNLDLSHYVSCFVLDGDDWEAQFLEAQANLPDYEKRSAIDLWELRPELVFPCQKCHGPGAPPLPAMTKGRLYPPGSLTSIGGRANLILSCNHCSSRTSSQLEVMSLLKSWIKSLGKPLLPEEERRKGKARGHSTKDLSATPTSPGPAPPKAAIYPSPKTKNDPQALPQILGIFKNRRNPRRQAAINGASALKYFSSTLSGEVNQDLQVFDVGTKEKFSKAKPTSSTRFNHQATSTGWRGFINFLKKKKLLEDSSAQLPPIKIPCSSEAGIPTPWNLSYRFIQADGNCLFRAVAFWILGSQEAHKVTRKACCEELFRHQEMYEPFVSFNDLHHHQHVAPLEIFNVFLQKSRQCGFWGGDHHLAALSQCYEARLVVLTHKGPTYEYIPRTTAPKRTIYLWYNGHTHYEILWNSTLHLRPPSPLSQVFKHLDPRLFAAPPLAGTRNQKNQYALKEKQTGSSSYSPKFLPVVSGQLCQPMKPQLEKSKTIIVIPIDFKTPKKISIADKPAKINSIRNSKPIVVIPPLTPRPTGNATQIPRGLIDQMKTNTATTSLSTPPATLVKGSNPSSIHHLYTQAVKKRSQVTSGPWDQPLAPHLKKPKALVPGLVVNHPFPLAEEYWTEVNKGLQTDYNVVRLSQTPIQFVAPHGFKDGWRISHQFIERSLSGGCDDRTGFYHALAFWIFGDQSRWTEIFTSFLNFNLHHLCTLTSSHQAYEFLFSVKDGKPLTPLLYLVAATLYSLVVVVVEVKTESASINQYFPPQDDPSNISIPQIFLLYNPEKLRYQIIWNPPQHQPQELATTAGRQVIPSPRTKMSSPLSLSSTSPSTSPPPKIPISQPPQVRCIPKVPSVDDLNTIESGLVLNYLRFYNDRGRCLPLVKGVTWYPFFTFGQFAWEGWRCTMGLILPGEDSLWRALSHWKFGTQEKFNKLKIALEPFGYNPLTINTSFRSITSLSEALGFIQKAADYLRVGIVTVAHVGGSTTVSHNFPRDLDQDGIVARQGANKTYFLFCWELNFEILYSRYHVSDKPLYVSF